ncbi:hypothetical protein BGZ73_006954 [Actinomortierella ambigua]|nr:hypothetical protein BGZ73_006954 [Actinomortierella ambigua]
MGMDWHILVLAAFEAVSQVLVIVLCGVLLSKTGFLTSAGQKAMSRVNLYFLTPCLLFVKIASEISWSQFVSYWPIPIFYAIFTFASWLLGRVGSFVLGFTREERNFVLASVMFANTNTLPMALMQSLAYSDAGKNLLRGVHDNPDEVAARGFSYILFYAIFGNFVRWSYGYNLLVPQETVVSPHSSFSPSPTSVVIVQSEQESPSEQESHLQLGPEKQGNVSRMRRISKRSRSWARRTLRVTRQLMTPPLVTAMFSLVVGLVPFLHHTLMNKGSKFYTFLVRPLEDCGDAAIPMIVLCLGAQVVEFSRQGQKPSNQEKGRDSQQPSSPLAPSDSLHHSDLAKGADPYSGLDRGDSDDSSSGSDTESGIESEKGGSAHGDGDETQRRLTQGSLTLHPTLSRVSTRSTLLNETVAATPNSGGSGTRPYTSLSTNTTALTLTIPTSTSGPPSYTTPTTLVEKQKDDGCSLVDSRRPSQATLLTGIPIVITPDAPNSLSSTTTTTVAAGCEESAERPTTPRSQRSDEIPLEYQQQARHKVMGPIPFVLLVRLFILPLLSLPIVMFHPRSLFPKMLATDPTFSLAMVLLASSPTAINIIQMCQIKGFFEKEMAGVLFWSYCVLGVPCVLMWSMVSLWVAGR